MAGKRDKLLEEAKQKEMESSKKPIQYRWINQSNGIFQYEQLSNRSISSAATGKMPTKQATTQDQQIIENEEEKEEEHLEVVAPNLAAVSTDRCGLQLFIGEKDKLFLRRRDAVKFPVGDDDDA